VGRVPDLGQRTEAPRVDRVPEAYDLVLPVHRGDVSRDAVVDDDDGFDHTWELRGKLEVVDRGAGPEHLRRGRPPLGELVRHRGVLNQDRVALRRQAIFADSDGEASARGEVGHVAAVGGVDRDPVAEPLELLADGQKVGLAPSDSGEAVRRKDDLHGRKSLRRTSTRTPGEAAPQTRARAPRPLAGYGAKFATVHVLVGRGDAWSAAEVGPRRVHDTVGADRRL
jgi:hypothetical protein